jgi:Nucleotide modification associated domain 3
VEHPNRDSNGRGRIYLANVGVNAQHRFVSPLHDDGSFTLVTIPETIDGPGLVHYGDVSRLRKVVPERYWNRATHYDPEFETLTYGDNCGTAPRAAALKSCREGDWIFFIARLVGAAGPVFGLVGGLQIEAILRDVRRAPSRQTMRRFGANAHIRRGCADPRYWDGFWVFGGGPGSCVFERVLVIGREEADLLFTDRSGGSWLWRDGRTDLQTIGSYTRSCRCVIDPEANPARAQEWWALLDQHDQVEGRGAENRGSGAKPPISSFEEAVGAAAAAASRKRSR